MAVVMLCASRANAASLIYFDDFATNPKINQGISFGVTLMADGRIRGQFRPGAWPISGMTRTDLHVLGTNAFGLNLADAVTVTMEPNRFFPPWVQEFNQEVGPFGVFDVVFDAGNADTLHVFLFSQPSGFTSLLEPFEPNASGLIMAAFVRSFQTGDSGFIGADAELDPTLVPEPGSMLLLGTGLLAAVRAARKRATQ